jgi:hypothetical protein
MLLCRYTNSTFHSGAFLLCCSYARPRSFRRSERCAWPARAGSGGDLPALLARRRMRGCRRSEAGRRCRDSAQPISSRALSTRPHAPAVPRHAPRPGRGLRDRPALVLLVNAGCATPCPPRAPLPRHLGWPKSSRAASPSHSLAETPIHPHLPRSPLTPPPPTPPFLLSPSGRRASAFLGPGAGLPARRRCGGAGSLRVSPPEPRARLLSFSSTCLQSRLSVVRYAGSKIFQRNVIVPLHEQHISLRRILIVLQLRATSLILAL